MIWAVIGSYGPTFLGLLLTSWVASRLENFYWLLMILTRSPEAREKDSLLIHLVRSDQRKRSQSSDLFLSSLPSLFFQSYWFLDLYLFRFTSCSFWDQPDGGRASSGSCATWTPAPRSTNEDFSSSCSSSSSPNCVCWIPFALPCLLLLDCACARWILCRFLNLIDVDALSWSLLLVSPVLGIRNFLFVSLIGFRGQRLDL